MSIAIGHEIKKLCKQKHIKTSELAKRMPNSRISIRKLWQKESIDSLLLFQISKALDFDFFSLYSNELGISSDSDQPQEPTILQMELEHYRKLLKHEENNSLLLKKLVSNQEELISIQRATIKDLENKLSKEGE